MSNSTNTTNIITIDGHSGSGKGTLAKLIANQLDWHLLDSGALYRVVAYIAERLQLYSDDNLASVNIVALSQCIESMQLTFKDDAIFIANLDLPNIDINPLIRNEQVGEKASQIAQIIEIREALLDYQRQFYQPPGLVADGRDMGTVVFPEAALKLFLTASIEERAERRYQQLILQGENANLAALVEQLRLRDDNDANRKHSPLLPAVDAIVIDSSQLNIDDVFNKAWAIVKRLII